MQAIMRRRLDVVIELIKRGADVNKSKANGFTPLMYAALNQAWDACEVLISNNADLEARNRTGDSVFTIAEREGTTEMLGVVLKKASTSR
jgi:ankyrin repeat protein